MAFSLGKTPIGVEPPLYTYRKKALARWRVESGPILLGLILSVYITRSSAFIALNTELIRSLCSAGQT